MVFIVFARPTKSTDDLLKSLYKNQNKLEHTGKMSYESKSHTSTIHVKHAEFTLGTGGVTLNRCDSNDTTVYVKSPLDQIQRLYFIFW